MSLIPILFSDWWEDLDRPHRLWDQHFGTTIDPDDLNDLDADVLAYRPHRRGGRRHHHHHPFLKGLNKRHGRGVSIVQADKDKFQVTLDVSQFTPEEVNVKVVDQKIVVEAKHDERKDEHGWISRQFVRKYMVPSQCDVDQVESHLSSDGILSISAPRKQPLQSESNGRVINIQYTGEPALISQDDNTNLSESQREQQTPQRIQQQQSQQPQQSQQSQQQRGSRKGNMKAA